MKSDDLVQEARKHFECLEKNGSVLGEIREIAPGIIAVFDSGIKRFFYYFHLSSAKFRADRKSLQWRANDFSGYPENCSPEVVFFVCGFKKPEKWDDVIEAAKMRVASVNGDILWFSAPQKIN